ncbi:MAG: signal peptidase I [Acidobacteriota bacterium]
MAGDLVRAALIGSILALFVQTFLVQPYAIVSRSMMPTLLPGDYVLVNRFVFAGDDRAWLPTRAIARGDLVLFRGALGHGRYVKRCVARGGDLVAIRDDRTVLNHLEVDAERAWIRRSGGVRSVRCPADTPPLRLLMDELYCLGDHRDHSVDSRHIGPIERQRVLGEPFLIYWSTAADSSGTTFGSASETTFEKIGDTERHDQSLPWARMLDETKNRLARTRWDRVLQPLQPNEL